MSSAEVFLEIKSDFLVIGSGVAGLYFSLKAAKYGTVSIVTKREKRESSTLYAQGGIASVLSREDSFDAHIKDTLEAGAGLCRPDVVEMVVKKGPNRILGLMELGGQMAGKENRGGDSYIFSPGYDPLYRRCRKGLSLHQQSGCCHRRRYSNGRQGRRSHSEYGIHPVSSHMPVSSKGKKLSNIRDSEGRRRYTASQRRDTIHGKTSSHEGPCPTGYRCKGH